MNDHAILPCGCLIGRPNGEAPWQWLRWCGKPCEVRTTVADVLRSENVPWVRCVHCGTYCTGRSAWCPEREKERWKNNR